MQLINHLWEHSFWLEWVWVIAAGTGWGYSIWALSRTRGDHKWAENPKNNMTAQQRFFARVIYQSQKMFLAKHSISLTIALLSVGLPPPPPKYIYVPQSIYAIAGCTLWSILMMAQQMMSAMWRRQVDTGNYKEAIRERKRSSSTSVVD